MRRRWLLLLTTMTVISGSFVTNAEENLTEAVTEATNQVGAIWDARNDITADEQLEITGIPLIAPEDAENVLYNVILASEEHPIAETVFDYEGKTWFLQAQATDLVELMEADEVADISGLYYEWEERVEAEVSGRSAYVYRCDEAGFIVWLDVVPGILYNLAVVGETTTDELVSSAEQFFVPAQGEVDGDESYSSMMIGGSDGPTSVFLAGKIGEEGDDNGLKLRVPQSIEDNLTTMQMAMMMLPIAYDNGQLFVAISNQTGAEDGYGNEYALQKKADGEWQDMEPIEDIQWTDLYHVLQDTEIIVEKYDLSVYGQLEPGDYKLVKDNLEAEFSLE